MGVHGLWELLAPVGRRVSVETLAGKRLAIDASIWMVQFMKAMRDEKGDMVRNAHLLGFFRRICKLLYLRTKPVFVFDGGTPALKRRTVIARRRQRENAQAKVRKTAEKLLLNHLKAMKLKEIAEDIKNQRQKQKNDTKGKKVSPDQVKLSGNDFGKKDVSSVDCNQEKLDEMLAASIMAEEGGVLANNSTMSTSRPYEEDDYEDEEMILPDMGGEVDPAVLAALPPSLQLDLLNQNQKQKQDNYDKGKKILSDKAASNLERDHVVSRSCNQEKLDEMLAASLMEEENRSFSNKASTSAAPYPVREDRDMDEDEDEDGDEDEDEDGDEEMILPAMDGEVDPSILAALPPSMQLDLLVQIRERLMAENRQKYQKVKKDPAKFSELQIESYLKTVAFRREIDQVQKVASGRGVDGVQTSRIASEANREFIFSSSFTGDKQVLTSARAEKSGDKQQAEDPSSVMHTAASTSKSNTVTGSKPEKSRRVFDDNIETYRDERGRVRVSKVRAMGIRMTRDLQRNLDLMKEIEKERATVECLINESNCSVPKTSSGKNFMETSNDGAESVKLKDTNEDSVLNNGASMEISFEDDDDIKCFDGDDEIFARLVAENPEISSNNIISSKNLSDASDSDSFWEEGTTEAKDMSFSDDVNVRQELPSKSNSSDDSEVEWEEGVCELTEHTLSESKKANSKGNLEEEAFLQEAIRRSLEDLDDHRSNSALPEDDKLEVPKGYACEGNGFFDPKDRVKGPILSGDDGSQQNRSTCEILGAVENPNGMSLLSVSKTSDSSGDLLKSSVACNPDNSRILVESSHEVHISSPEQPLQDASERAKFSKEAPYAESVTPSKEKEVSVVGQGPLCTSNEVGGFSTSFNKVERDSSHTSVLCGDVSDDKLDDQKIATEAEPSCSSVEMTNPAVRSLEAVTNELTRDIENEENLGAKEVKENCFQEIEHSLENSALKDNEDFQVKVTESSLEEGMQILGQERITEASLEDEMQILGQECITEASLEEEMQILGQERMDLGDEQRRLERNAESVSGEMFTECQELLQMFGLPYIIAPMEAEAQCAYMELANLVEGVVTDDSDVFLFGARNVYKNIFDDRKYVETYFMKDIEKDLGLTREQLIRMALLLGSDYTEGVSGIGIVNAIEVVHAFPEEDGLQKFRDWIESPDPTILGKFDTQTDSIARKRESKIGDDANCSKSNMQEASASNENISEAREQKQSSAREQKQSSDHIQEIRKTFMDKHRKVSKNWHIPPPFPSEAVVSAYICPQVDKSTEPFTWGRPDHFVLRKLCWDKFGWGSQKADDLLLPVLKEYNKHETQLRLEAFYTFNERFAKIQSKRIKKAVKGITGKTTLEFMDDDVQEVSRSKNKKESMPDKSGNDQSQKLPQEAEDNFVENQSNYRKKSTPRQSRKRKIPRDGAVSESLILSEGRQDTNRRSRVNGGCRGRGKGKGKGSSSFVKTSSSDGDGDNDDDVEEVQVETVGRPLEVRRSRRSRKPVNYSANDSEIDDMDKSTDQSDKNCSDGEALNQDLSCDQDRCENADSSLGPEKNIENLSPSKGLDEDYLEKAGGFCPDNGENDQPGVSQQGHSHLDVEFSEEYLKTGGGFCMDEGETGPDDNSTSSRATAAVLDNADLSHCSDLGITDACVSEPTMDQANPTVNDHQSKLGMLLQENDADNTQTTPMGALRAMPHLRKRRRKR